MRTVLRVVLRALFRVGICGAAEAVTAAGPLLAVANHRSAFDVLLLGLLLPERWTIVVPPADAAVPWVRWVLRWLPHEILDVGNAAALKPLLKRLKSGEALVAFPEARTSPSAALGKVYPVPALAAVRSGARVVPLHIADGAADTSRGVLHRWLCRVRLGIALHVCAAQRIEVVCAGPARERRVRAARALMVAMQEAALAAQRYRSLFEHFLAACIQHGRRCVWIEDEKQGAQTYGGVLRGSLALARLARSITCPGERVGVLLPNVTATVQTVLGLSGAGRVPVMLNYSGAANAAMHARAAAGVRTVITSRAFVEQARLKPLVDALSDCDIVYLEDLRRRFGVVDRLWLLAFAMRFPRRAVVRPSAMAPAVVLLTSGSDGEPKAVALSHRAIIANVMQIRTVMAFTPQDKILNPLPLYHAYSFTAGMVLPLITGTRVRLYLSPLHYRAIPDIAYRSDCTVLFGTSTFLSYYASYAHAADFGRLRYVISGGEKLAPEVARVWLEKFGVRIYEGYGCTECAPVISLATRDAFRPGTVGRLLPGIDHRIEPVAGIERGGLLHVRGPNVMLGHYTSAEPGVLHACRSTQGPGWHATGDIVEIDDEGFVVIRGRMRRFAKIAGEMISLDQVEEVARAASPAHHHAAVLKVEEYGGETTVLYTTDAGLDRIALQKAARACGARDFAVARHVVTLRALPMLASGKTDYATLNRMAASQVTRSRRRLAWTLSADAPAAIAPRPKAAEPALSVESGGN
jgi:acyl-[acyl-carrier-protein]-phospholipid O-acyltransferase/long-chain-fatty-acid--[acyl-carrier-protein] ligase